MKKHLRRAFVALLTLLVAISGLTFAPSLVQQAEASEAIADGAIVTIRNVEYPAFLAVGNDDAVTQVANNSFSCLLYTSPSPRDATLSRMPSSA